MIMASIGASKVVISDETVAKKWDNYGTESNLISATDLSDIRPYKAISLLTSFGETEVGVFDTENYTFSGNTSTLLAIRKLGGYLRMLPTRGKHEGVSYTQTIFLYDSSFDLGRVVECIKH